MKIDLHVHTAERSPCGRGSEQEMVESAIRHGLDALCFTDHHQFVPDDRLVALNRKYPPFRIFQGIEITASGEDLLVFGVADPELAQAKYWTYTDLWRFVRSRGGLMVLAHPCRYHPIIDEAYVNPPDAVERLSNNIKPETRDCIQAFLDRTGCRAVVASDAHDPDRVGFCHVVLDAPVETVSGMIECIRAGRFTCST